MDHSLVLQREEGGVDGEPRFGMLHIIREYSLEQAIAEAPGEADSSL